jgi:4-hydroxybenzoate polyprenyltransferase
MEKFSFTGRTWKWIHLGFVFFFVALWGLAAVMGWLKSVTFVSHVSMVALVLAEVSAWQAARTEQKQDGANN